MEKRNERFARFGGAETGRGDSPPGLGKADILENLVRFRILPHAAFRVKPPPSSQLVKYKDTDAE
jgi:hypothetical protein